jgi:L-ascorbate metabolism protein UlaG (beta-lactamase superfamily)
MKIKWYGHAAFRLTTSDGVNIIIDPYEPGAFGLSYGPITDPADIVLVTHEHTDHSHVTTIGGTYSDIRKEGPYEIRGVRIRAIPSFHDLSKGLERGQNLIFVVEADDLKVVHLGDLGHLLEHDAIEQIGKTDVLLIPVGSVYTIDGAQATHVMNDIKPSITIPMHFNTEKSFPLDGVDKFTLGKERVKMLDSAEIEVTKAGLPREPEVLVLRYAM